MNESRVTYQQVASAAKMLQDKGENPSLNGVIKLLGNQSEKQIVSQYLKEWESQEHRTTNIDIGPITGNLEQYTNELRSIRKKQIPLENIQELDKILSLIRATLESTADGILMVNREGKIIDWNAKFIEMWKMPLELLEAEDEVPCLQYVLSQVKDPENLFKEVTKLYNNPDEQGNLGEIEFRDGRVFERYSQPHRMGDQIVGRVWSFRDVTERKKVEAALHLRNRAIESSSQGMLILNAEGPDNMIEYVNPAFEQITGYSKSDVIGKGLATLYGSDITQPSLRKFQLAIQERHETQVVLRNYRKDGSLFWNELYISPVMDEKNTVTHFICTMSDISERRKMEEQLLRQATHDTLTNLPNRSLLLDRAEQTLLSTRLNHSVFAMLFLDLDRFKLVNDSLGHNIGDELLKEVSKRLLRNIRESDTIARIGGDEFVALFPLLNNAEEVIPLAQRILKAIAKPYNIKTHELNITASVGISFYPKDGKTVEQLMKNADISMYHAKDSGRNNFKFYTNEMNERLTKRMTLESNIRVALEKDQFSLYYQPIFDLRTNRVVSVEALIRWLHPTLGMISPMDFIPLAEESGMIIPISEWVMQTAIRQNIEWQKQGIPPIRMAVNMSARQFKQPNVGKSIQKLLDDAHLESKYLELELTETMLIENANDAITILNNLKDMGVQLAIDDFGTGYSSLNYLKQFPVDKLKIDRSFVNDVNASDNDAAITKAIINLGHSLKLTVLAEGVEKQEQLNFLLENQCDQVQGYFFSKPLEAKACTDLIVKNVANLKTT
jgi:diguanylate cyclase (GGDEF)-like protein/PAS domain S-box-containing protein